MEKVIYNLVFNRKKQLNAEGKALIQVEAYLNRQKRYFSTKVYVKPCIFRTMLWSWREMSWRRDKRITVFR